MSEVSIPHPHIMLKCLTKAKQRKMPDRDIIYLLEEELSKFGFSLTKEVLDMAIRMEPNLRLYKSS